MLHVYRRASFKQDVKNAERRGKDMELLKKVILDLVNQVSLSAKYKDHPLVGQYKGDRECHIESDWLLIYTVIENDLFLVRTGTHSDLFR